MLVVEAPSPREFLETCSLWRLQTNGQRTAVRRRGVFLSGCYEGVPPGVSEGETGCVRVWFALQRIPCCPRLAPGVLRDDDEDVRRKRRLHGAEKPSQTGSQASNNGSGSRPKAFCRSRARSAAFNLARRRQKINSQVLRCWACNYACTQAMQKRGSRVLREGGASEGGLSRGCWNPPDPPMAAVSLV
jgi:hypothetical protein